ncbi:M15 family metallopeptidase [Sphingobacterium faecium]|jgi:D-alanyl-D-alanine dipeptidase|uniref:M15 family metallopeptidase n=1 Tax=Sphingobacterium faecium TaxID=34087 RepID=UPI0004E5FAFC|nr:M15 family metallopeptidase [Sphingobacterium faecium]UXD68116.1 M15 family metallopeptidase [Sphingobacterium faecium]CDT09788.1 D-alanyl-D-alanine dipeptidase [Sphingobacterium sp. PM2-P1-29]
MKIYFCLVFILIIGHASIFAQQKLPKGFSYVQDIIPDINFDLRYYGSHNFVGKKIDGYKSPVLILTTAAAQALEKVEKELNKKGMALKIFDAYRPQKAVDHFKKWATNVNDTLGKKEFYPQLDKRNLFKLGFIAGKSGHSRGSTVDLTIITIHDRQEIDMGSPFDFFGSISHFDSQEINGVQKQNRTLLKNIMSKYGFKGYAKEWWHFTLINEPYQKTYFDFNID